MNTLSLWTRRDPFAAEFDALVRNAFDPAGAPASSFVPAAELTRDGEDAVVTLDLPGVDVAENVTVEVERATLVIRGERHDTRADEGRGRSEVRYGSFRRSFSLPARVSAEAVSASYDNGVLTVRVAGAYADATPQRIEITAGAAH